MSSPNFYPIGQPGRAWGPAERAQWRAQQGVKRSYEADVLSQLPSLERRYEVLSYGELPYAEGRYPLVALRSRRWSADLPLVLLTGGVHGYETSGVHGALAVAREAGELLDSFRLLVAPCVSPWGYETINRWNPEAVDPNRSFRPDSPAREAAALMALVAKLDSPPLVHMDLHETTDTDDTEFRPARAARDGLSLGSGGIPDGFYTVGDAERPEPGFQAAVIAGVRRVTHIAPPDAEGRIIGKPVEQPGVIHYSARRLGLCMGMSEARFVTTTEVYPDSPRVDAAACVQSQVAAVRGGLEYALEQA